MDEERDSQHKVHVVGPRFAVLSEANRIRTASNHNRKRFAERGGRLGRETKLDESFERIMTDQTASTNLNREEFSIPVIRMDVLYEFVIPNLFSQLRGSDTFFGTASEFQDHDFPVHA